MQVSTVSSSRPWTVVGHVDATPDDIGQIALDQVMVMHQQPVESKAHLVMRVACRSNQERLAQSVAKLALGAAIAKTCFLGPPALQRLGTRLMLDGSTGLASASRRGSDSVELFSGTRSFEMASGSGSDAPREGTLLGRIRSSSPPSPDRLADFFVRTMQRYPSQYSAVYVSGHGKAWTAVAGLPVEKMARTLKKVVQAQGHPLDLLVLDACLMSNLEALRQLAPYARFAVASESPLGGAGLPLAQALAGLDPEHPEHLGEAIMQAARGETAVTNLALVDLEKVPGLATQVEALGGQLEQWVRQGHGTEVRRSFHESARYPADMADEVGLTDLGVFLDNILASDGVVPSISTSARAARDLLGQAIPLCYNRDPQDRARGLTIQGPAHSLDYRRYTRATAMKTWGAFLESVRP